MKLHKKTRTRFHKADGAPVEFSWPPTAPEPFRGHKYPIYTKGGRAFSIRLESVKRRSSGTKVIAVVDNDSNRPMIGLQGVRLDDGSYESEPERVHAVYENQLAQEASQRNVFRAGEQRQSLRREDRESSVPTSTRSQRTKERHVKGLAA